MYKFFIKRLLDFVIALLAIVLLSPLFIVIIFLLLVTGEHEVFYLQNRVGYRNKNFKIWKFATMLKNSPNMGTGSLTVRNDPRVTSVGRFLRKSKINELPQIINVLIGNMSLVGPRPQMKVDFEKFSDEIQGKIYNAKPGITGIGSIVFRDEEEFFSNTSMDPHEFDKLYISPYKGELETWYQENLSFITDLKILYYTVLVVIKGQGNYSFSGLQGLPKKPEFMVD